MKQIRNTAVVAIIMMAACMTAKAENQPALNDSVVNVVKVRNLEIRKEALEKQIAEEDRRRNAVLTDVLPETLEAMNERQDSICLALRSELTEVELELKELGAGRKPTVIPSTR